MDRNRIKKEMQILMARTEYKLENGEPMNGEDWCVLRWLNGHCFITKRKNNLRKKLMDELAKADIENKEVKFTVRSLNIASSLILLPW